MFNALIARFTTPNVDALIGAQLTLRDKLRDAQAVLSARALELDSQAYALLAKRDALEAESDRAANIADKMDDTFGA